jgi:hypothetical protein
VMKKLLEVDPDLRICLVNDTSAFEHPRVTRFGFRVRLHSLSNGI